MTVYQFPRAAAGGIDTSSGGGDDGGMDGARIAKLESDVEYVKRDISDLRDDVRELRKGVEGIRTTDFRVIFGAIIFVAISLAGLMAHGFHWI